MLTNRPEFHLVDCAAMHLGAVPFSLYNSAAREQLAQILRDSGARVLVTERAFAPTAEVLRDAAGLEHVIVIETVSTNSRPVAPSRTSPSAGGRWRRTTSPP